MKESLLEQLTKFNITSDAIFFIWYCKFVMPRPFKWGILGACTIILSKNIFLKML